MSESRVWENHMHGLTGGSWKRSLRLPRQLPTLPYVFNVRAGEDIRILDLAYQANPGLPAHDFWLLDDITVVRMDYPEHGAQLGRELLQDIDPAPYVRWKHLALAHAQQWRYLHSWLNST
jgi:hypothetical protein